MSGSPVTAASAITGAPSAPYDTGRVVRQRGHADGVEIGDAEADENRRDDRPRISEADDAFQQRAECPRQHQRLDPDVVRRVVDHPALEPLEVAGRRRAC